MGSCLCCFLLPFCCRSDDCEPEKQTRVSFGYKGDCSFCKKQIYLSNESDINSLYYFLVFGVGKHNAKIACLQCCSQFQSWKESEV